MIKIKEGYAKLIGASALGAANRLLLSNGGDKDVSDFASAESLNNYLPLTGGTLNNASGIPLIIIGSSVLSEIRLGTNNDDVSKGAIAWQDGLGTFLLNYPSECFIGIKNDGSPYYYNKGTNTLWHSGNLKNLSDLNNDLYWANIQVKSSKDTTTVPTFGGITDTPYIRSNTTDGYFIGNRKVGAGTTDNGLMLYTYGGTPISLYTDSTERVRIQSNGNVGIGDSNPAYKLEVAGSICGTVIHANREGSATAGGVSLYSNSDPMTYGIAFRGTGTYGTHGYVTAANDWATYLTMSDTLTRGWIFRRGSTNVASIAGNGNMAIGQNLKFSNEAHISTNRSTDCHYGYTFNLTANEQSIGMYSGPIGEAGGVVISPDGCLIYNSSDCGYNLQVRDKDLGADLTNIATLTFGIEQTGYYAWSRGGFKKNGSDDSYVLLGGGGHKLESSLSVNYATSATYAGKLSIHDVRDATRNPNYFDAQRMTAWFNSTGTPDGSWYSGIHMKGWTNGYTSWELCSYSSTGTANDYNLYFRSGNNTTWGSWKTIITSGNIGSQSVNYATSAGNADTVDSLHASDFVRAYGTYGTSYSYDSDWGLSIVTFDPIVSGTAPAQNPNITILNLGNAYYRRKQLAFTYSTNDIYYRRRTDSSWSGWVRLALAGESYTKSEADSRFVNVTGDTMTGNLTVPSLNSYYLFRTTDIAEGAANLGTLATAHTITFFRNGIMIPYKMDNANDGGMIRTKGASEDACVFEMATWDDSGAGETIQLNYYSTTSQLTPTYSNIVPKVSGTLLNSGNWPSYIGDHGYVMREYIIDATGLDLNTWYPVTMTIGACPNVRIEILVSLNSGSKPSWSTHGSGFSVRKIWEVNGFGWGTNPVHRTVFVSDYAHASADPVRGMGDMGYSSTEYVYVRGGGRYYFYTSHNITPYLRTSTYVGTADPYYQAISPTTTAPGIIAGFLINRSMYASHFYENSDIKLKENVNLISSSDNIPLLKLFDWKSDGKHSYGLIAQELEEMGYSELVEESGDHKTVNYSAALSLIVGKLQVKIKELEKEIENLKNKN